MAEAILVRRILFDEKVFATFHKATQEGLGYMAQIVYPGKKDLLPVYFLIPLQDIGTKTFLSTIRASELAKWMVLR